MKKLFIIPTLFGIMIATSFMSSCGNAAQKEKTQQDSISKKDTAPQSAYICPMGAECGKSDKPGKCESCGMELIENKHNKKNL